MQPWWQISKQGEVSQTPTVMATVFVAMAAVFVPLAKVPLIQITVKHITPLLQALKVDFDHLQAKAKSHGKGFSFSTNHWYGSSLENSR